jgi:hypothetical protein
MSKSFRNVTAGNAIGRIKAKVITNDRGNRRANDARHDFDWRAEMAEMDFSNETEISASL